jgi:protein arginine kinase
MRELRGLPEGGLGWLDASGPDSDIVLSTRIRLARNLATHHFAIRADEHDRDAVLEAVRVAAEATQQLGDGSLVPIPDLEPHIRQVLYERHLVSKELVATAEHDGNAAALLLSRDEAISVMVNEEDHLRLQCLVSGFRLHDAWRLADQLDRALSRTLPYAFHPEFGYLTSCPTNVGTGLRASILVHLPGLVLTQEIGRVLQGIAQVGLTFRGLYGEGSEVVGNFFQVSNQTTLGKSEEDLIDHLQKVVQTVIEYERRARSVLMRDAPAVIEDKVWRAYGLLRFARSMTFDEVMNLLSGIRLGVGLKLLSKPRVQTLNQIMIFTQAAHLEQLAGCPLTSTETDVRRAEYVRGALAAEGDPEGA